MILDQIRMIHTCQGEQDRPVLGLSEDGRIFRMEENRFRELEFNKIYEGYYCPCVFTALECVAEGFVAAGLGEDGLPHVYRSLMGGVWEPANLMVSMPANGIRRVTGRVNQILYDPKVRQVIILCENGEIAFLPDCPKCVRILKVAEQPICEGRLEGRKMVMVLFDGSKIRINIDVNRQYRIAVSYAGQKLAESGYLVDLRPRVRQGEVDFQVMLGINEDIHLHLSAEELDAWLETVPKDTFLTFYCTFGINSDEAAGRCRDMGYSSACSLGGAMPLMHVE